MIPRYAPRWYGMYAMGSMITNVHKSRCRQYSKASLDGKQCKSKAMGLSMQWQKVDQDVVEVTLRGMSGVSKDE